MPGEDYRRTIADYLLGRRRVSRAELERACDLARSDATYVRFLTSELGLDLGARGACRRFEARVAEFCTLSSAERRAEMPELAAHADTCPVCRETVWTVRPLWRARAGERATSGARMLVEAIELAVDRAGALIEQGLGPPSLPIAAVAAAMGGVQDTDLGTPSDVAELAARKEWVLRDDEAEWSVRLTVASAASGGAQLVCRLEPHDGTADQAVDTRLELYREPEHTLVFAGRVADVAAEPLAIEPGRWTLRVEMLGTPALRSWDIPLTIVDLTGDHR